jgi:hypothetical protein
MIRRKMGVGRISQIWVCAIALVLFLGMSAAVAHAQDPTPTPPPVPAAPPGVQVPGVNELDKVYAIVQMVSDLAQGKVTPNPDRLFEQSKQSATDLLSQQGAGIFFLDFADPNLGINQFAARTAGLLLALTPLYVLAYVVMLVYSVYRERPIPNPILYALLVIAVMGFLAAFAVIARGMSDVGRAAAIALSGGGDEAFFARATLLDQVVRVLTNLQHNNGLLALIALLASIVLFLITLLQLVYRGIALILLRLLSVLVIPFSVLLEGTRPRAAGRIVSGFFESWFDLVTKVAVLLIVIALAASDGLSDYTWLVLPAGLLLVVLSWKFFSIPFVMVRDAAGRAWGGMVPAASDSGAASLPASAEAMRAREIDEARRRMLEE